MHHSIIHPSDYTHIAGVDEVGRGCLAGPVVAAAVRLKFLPPPPIFNDLKDSKKLTHIQRYSFYKALLPHIEYAIGMCSPQEIDQLNIHHATLKAMQKAILSLPTPPLHVYIDGRFLPALPMRSYAFIGGDQFIPLISLASIIAKVTRDALMQKLSLCYPEFKWHKNAGYGTKEHLNGLIHYGYTPHHRKSYKHVIENDKKYKENK